MQSVFKLGLSLASMLVLAGCNVGPNYHEPSFWSPSTWSRKVQQPSGTGQATAVPSKVALRPVDPQWWAVFHDSELTTLEQRVAANNLDVRSASLRLAASRQQHHIASAEAFPTVNGSGSYSRTRLSPRGEFGLVSSSATGMSAQNGMPASALGEATQVLKQPFNLWQYGFDASWEVDLWGRVRRTVEAADATIDASEEDRRDVLVAMQAELARDYMQLRNVQAQLRIAQENRQVAQQSVKVTQERVKSGLATDLDADNATAQLAAVEAIIPQLDQQQAQAINQLSFLLAENPGALAGELQQPQAVPAVPPEVPVGLPSELAHRRPDIRRAEAQLHSATAEIGAAQANFYPTVTISGNLQLQGLHFTYLGNWDSRTYTMGPSITIPIFEGGRLKAQLELRKVEQQEAAVTFQRTVLNAFHEVDNALVAYQAEQKRHEHLEQEVGRNRHALDLARQQYRQGLVTFLRVLDAQRQALDSQQQLQDSTAKVSTNLVALYLALGGGWEDQFPVPITTQTPTQTATQDASKPAASPAKAVEPAARG